MTDKPLKIEKVEGCGECPFEYIDDYGGHCTQSGSPDNMPYPLEEGDKHYPPDCPLINANICVELVK